MKNIDKIYCCNYLPLTERRQRIDNFFKTKSYYDKLQFIDKEPPPDDHKKMYVSKSEYSLLFKHFLAIADQIKNQYKFVLILEDDAILPMENIDFDLFIEQSMKEFIPFNQDMLILGGGKTLEVPKKKRNPNIFVYQSDTYDSRYSHAYIVNLKIAELLYNFFKHNVTLPVDHLINRIKKDCFLKICWTHPYIKQSTIEGIEETSINKEIK